ncbi:putative aspergillopepsin-2 precursor [Talaromyces proteolyticus]|uniref:Aspergillopepsin-2 n=1 Tax=Talaromyces proteolyticus TaxID=1131652 RepID=A0AAD4L1B2_9EURO|nr:putative aspergillopepsin-2 precursor [Talaromyces proteolyticus]KAH8705738.1 putative aspergillopepsin-2 precursor [Talaromyces proteolyticus]
MPSIKELIGIAVLASTCFASTFTRHSAGGSRGSHLSTSSLSGAVDVAGSGNILSSSNWAGAVLQSTGVTGVAGTFTVPTPKIPSGGDSTTSYCGCAWVGVDGELDVCPNGGLIQAGATWCIRGGTPSFYAWFEWWPAQLMMIFDNFSVNAGDEIQVAVTATSTTTGNTVLENLTQGTSISHTWNTESPALCKLTAEWIVEDFTDYYSNGSISPAPFANYGSVTFTNNSATVNGASVDVSGAQPANMVVNGKTVSQSTISNGKVTVTYQG